LKSFPKLLGFGLLLVAAVVGLRADIPAFFQDVVTGAALDSALFRIMNLPDGVVTHARPAWEARSHLDKLIQRKPNDSDLYAIKAQEDERAGDYDAAEQDWKHATLAELADFYARRAQPDKELSTLLQLGAAPLQASERFQVDSALAQWSAFTRAVKVSDDALLPAARHREIYEAWMKRFPRDVEPYQAYLNWTIQQKDSPAAIAAATRLKAAFPNDSELAINTDADLAALQNGLDAAIAVYDKAFSPLWPESLRARYYAALTNAHQLRAFVALAQAEAAARPTDFRPVLRIFFYAEQQNRKDLADQQLLLFLSRRASAQTAWTAAELHIAAELFNRVRDYDEAARAYYLLYELPSAAVPEKEEALASLISLLLDVPEQPLHFGTRDLSLYKNIAQIDRHPGFLNGILSLFLNTTFPDYQYQTASQTAVTYFHRASASRLLDVMRQQFPSSHRTPELEAKLFNAYATYGQTDAVIRFVPPWMERNRDSTEYVNTAMLLADAYVVRNDSVRELALYNRLLVELANKSDHVPIGEAGTLPVQPPQAANVARSPDYARVLDRCISRLVQLSRPVDAIALLRQEIDRNPDDPGIYERLALFVEQNQFDRDLEETYRRALAHFKDTSWADKLARFYVRKERDSDYEALTRQIVDIFKGSEVALFLDRSAPRSDVLARQINLYAQQRFPRNLVFVNNLLRLYRSRDTEDLTAYGKLLREYWFYDSQLRTEYFKYLSWTGKLQTELASLPAIDAATKDSNLAELELRGEGHAWLTDYEGAAPALLKLAELSPGDRAANDRAISVERSLAPTVDGAFQAAIHLAEQDVKAAPAQREASTRLGEIYADRELYAQAKLWWNQMAAMAPGRPDGYLDAATVFWDYFQYDDALRVIGEAERKLQRPDLFGYEAGAIYENQGKPKEAIDAYVKAVLHNGNDEARSRLLRLSSLKATGALVEQRTAVLVENGFDSAGFQLRLGVMEKRDRRADLESLLRTLLSRAGNSTQVFEVRDAAIRLGFDEVGALALQRIVELTTDPVEKLQARIDLARFDEAHSRKTEAEQEFASLLTEHRNLLGVVRAAVDFYWRSDEQAKAVTTLEAAADRAQPPYRKSFRREAAQKAADAKQYDEARRLLDRLLSEEPHDSDLLAEKAATFGAQNDNAGLVAFYADELRAMQNVPLPGEDKTSRIAALRRGYIPALIAQQQYIDALEQYQLVLNAYPEDLSLASEVARFAEAHQLTDRVGAYYAKAAQDSPRDYRWPLVLARIDTSLRRYPEAVAAYDKAAYVRPDRADIFLAKVDLETRLLRFDDAIKTYQKVFELTYHDTRYLADQAELEARLGKPAEAVRLLRAAYVDPNARNASGFVIVMQKLAQWHLYREVDRLFQEARPILDANSKQQALSLEVQALTLMRRPGDALALAAASVDKPRDTVPLVAALGEIASRYWAPSEKAALLHQLEGGTIPVQISKLGLSQAAGLHDFEVRELLRRPSHWRELDTLQSARLQFESLGQELEEIAPRVLYPERLAILQRAFAAYADAGDVVAQLRLRDYSGSEFPRLFVQTGGDLDSRLTELARTAPERADEVVQYLFTHQSPAVVDAAIVASGRLRNALWTHSYQALGGLYFMLPDLAAAKDFDAVLGPRTVGGELADKSPDAGLRGANWFYYGARYGEYLTYRKLSGADDLLAAPVEASAVASNSYVELGQSYQDVGQVVRARAMYEYALQLSPKRADVYDRLALLAMEGHRTAQAISYWKHGFDILAARVEEGPLQPDYWQTAQILLSDMNRYHLVSELKPAADAMLHAYVKRNGAYQFTSFLAGMFDHAPDQKAALDWAIELSRLTGMEQILNEILSSQWISERDKDPLYHAQIASERKAVAEVVGEARQQAQETLITQLNQYAHYLEKQERWADAWAVAQQIEPENARPNDILLLAGALSGHLDELLLRYRAKPDHAPRAEEVLGAALSIEKLGRQDIALVLKEYEYGRELEGGAAPASAWFGMARVRFEQKRQAEGLALIRGVTLSVGVPFENLQAAVRVLEDSSLKEEAARYATEWKTAEPWSDEARLAEARLKDDSELDEIRRSPEASYQVRVRAARCLRDLGASKQGADELATLTRKTISPAEATQPYFVEARLFAAGSADAPAQVMLLREAIAIDPELGEARLDLAEAALRRNLDSLGLAAFASFDALGDAPPDAYVRVLQLSAEARVRQGDLSNAVELYTRVLAILKEPATKKTLQSTRDMIAKKRDLEVLNAERAPVVGKDIVQQRIVRPRLAALPLQKGTAE
jgi:tetratricopeptide (TPR) repeat protein